MLFCIVSPSSRAHILASCSLACSTCALCVCVLGARLCPFSPALLWLVCRCVASSILSAWTCPCLDLTWLGWLSERVKEIAVGFFSSSLHLPGWCPVPDGCYTCRWTPSNFIYLLIVIARRVVDTVAHVLWRRHRVYVCARVRDGAKKICNGLEREVRQWQRGSSSSSQSSGKWQCTRTRLRLHIAESHYKPDRLIKGVVCTNGSAKRHE